MFYRTFKLTTFSTICCLALSCVDTDQNTSNQSFQVSSFVDSTVIPVHIQVDNYTNLNVRDDWEMFGYAGSFLACDTLGVYISVMGANDFHGISSYSHDGTHRWTQEDSIILGGRQILSGIADTPAWTVKPSDNILIAGYWWNIVFMPHDGSSTRISIPINPESCITKSSFSPADIFSVNNGFVFEWNMIYFLPSAILSYTDKSMSCLWELSMIDDADGYTLGMTSNNMDSLCEIIPLLSFDSIPYRPAFNIACTDSTIFVNPNWLDTVLELDNEGNILRTLTGNHIALSERNVLIAPEKPRYVRNMIGHMEYLGDNMLAILYGPGAFPSDSSEIWCVNLSTGNYGVLPFSRAVTTFSANMENLIISSCMFSQDSASGYWKVTDGEISVASWDLTPITSQHE